MIVGTIVDLAPAMEKAHRNKNTKTGLQDSYKLFPGNKNASEAFDKSGLCGCSICGKVAHYASEAFDAVRGEGSEKDSVTVHASQLGNEGSVHASQTREPTSSHEMEDEEEKEDEGLISGIAKDFTDELSGDTCCSNICNTCFGCETTEAGGEMIDSFATLAGIGADSIGEDSEWLQMSDPRSTSNPKCLTFRTPTH